MNNEIRLIKRITEEYLDLKDGDVVEIVCPYEERDFSELLKERLKSHGVHEAYVTYTNGPTEKEINKGYREYLDERIGFYKDLVSRHFIRISLLSPFSMPMGLSLEVSLYKKHSSELFFLEEYLLHAQRCMVLKPNQAMADHLKMSLRELWDEMNLVYDAPSLLDEKKEYLSSLHFRFLHFETEEGTNVTFTLPESFSFIGRKITEDGRTFQPNAPSFEIFTAPLKYGSSGKIVFTKPLFHGNREIKDYSLRLEKGRVVHNKNLNAIIANDESLQYVGEVAICPFRDKVYQVMLLDENSGCHIALGNSYPYGIESDEEFNHSARHIDMVFGSSSLFCEGIREDGTKVTIMENGKVVV